MRIPARSDYALRALIAIAAANGEFVKAETLSEREAIPYEYLQNILRDLRRSGLLIAQRGYEGGYRLARPAEAITVSEVLEAVASPFTEPYAKSGSIWDALVTSTRAWLGSTTVADLVEH
jgi:Rrf2 family protein